MQKRVIFGILFCVIFLFFVCFVPFIPLQIGSTTDHYTFNVREHFFGEAIVAGIQNQTFQYQVNYLLLSPVTLYLRFDRWTYSFVLNELMSEQFLNLTYRLPLRLKNQTIELKFYMIQDDTSNIYLYRQVINVQVFGHVRDPLTATFLGYFLDNPFRIVFWLVVVSTMGYFAYQYYDIKVFK